MMVRQSGRTPSARAIESIGGLSHAAHLSTFRAGERSQPSVRVIAKQFGVKSRHGAAYQPPLRPPCHRQIIEAGR